MHQRLQSIGNDRCCDSLTDRAPVWRYADATIATAVKRDPMPRSSVLSFSGLFLLLAQPALCRHRRNPGLYGEIMPVDVSGLTWHIQLRL